MTVRRVTSGPAKRSKATPSGVDAAMPPDDSNAMPADAGGVEVVHKIIAFPISSELFAPFGEIVSAGMVPGKSANRGTAVRCDWSASLESTRALAQPNLAVFRSVAKTLPFQIRLLEKHPCSSQAFLPMICTRFLVCVAPAKADGTPDIEQLVAFQCGPGQGINYRRDVWHHPILALDGPADFAMLAWEDGGPLDCIEYPLSETVMVYASTE